MEQLIGLLSSHITRLAGGQGRNANPRVNESVTQGAGRLATHSRQSGGKAPPSHIIEPPATRACNTCNQSRQPNKSRHRIAFMSDRGSIKQLASRAVYPST